MLYQYRENLYCTCRHANLVVHTTQMHVAYTAQSDTLDTEMRENFSDQRGVDQFDSAVP